MLSVAQLRAHFGVEQKEEKEGVVLADAINRPHAQQSRQLLAAVSKQRMLLSFLRRSTAHRLAPTLKHWWLAIQLARQLFARQAKCWVCCVSTLSHILACLAKLCAPLLDSLVE